MGCRVFIHDDSNRSFHWQLQRSENRSIFRRFMVFHPLVPGFLNIRLALNFLNWHLALELRAATRQQSKLKMTIL